MNRRSGRECRSESARTHAASEALYWLGVADYRASGDPGSLVRRWGDLRERYPRSPWTGKAHISEGSFPEGTLPGPHG